MAVSELENEFRNALTRQADLHIGPSSVAQSGYISDTTSHGQPENYYIADDQPEEHLIYNLRGIAEKMNSAGYLCDCVEVYKSVRKRLVDTIFKGLGIKELSNSDIRGFVSEDLKRKIELWIRAAMFCVRILFAREKKLAEQIFKGLGNATYEEYFIEIVKDAASQLFNFANSLTTGRRSPKMLFKVLHLYHQLLYLLPDINVLFGLESSNNIRTTVYLIKSRFEEVVRGILDDFEHDVVHEMSTISDDRGTIHSLTKYVMNYINQILSYKKILTDLIVSEPSTTFGDLMIPDVEFAQCEAQTPLEHHLVLIIVVLRFKLEAKSKYYKDDSLAHLFTTNNVHYIVKQIKGSPELQATVGEVYMNKLSEYVCQATIRYQNSTCNKLLCCLRHEGLHWNMWFYYKLSKSAVRKRITKFNALFGDFHQTRVRWIVPDLQLREEIRLSLLEKLIPAYNSFLDRFKIHTETCIKYSIEDLETLSMRWHDHLVYPIIPARHEKHKNSLVRGFLHIVRNMWKPFSTKN